MVGYLQGNNLPGLPGEARQILVQPSAIGATYYLLIMVTSVPVGRPMPGPEGLIRIVLVLILMPLTYLTGKNGHPGIWRAKKTAAGSGWYR